MAHVNADGMAGCPRRWCFAVAVFSLALALAVAPVRSGATARPVPPASDQARWVSRVQRLWLTHNWSDHSRAQQQQAEKALLSEGKPRATAALKPMLARPFENPLRLQAAFAMALLGLDYAAGRDTLLRYLRALSLNRGPTEVDWERLYSKVADPQAPEDENRVISEDIAGLVFVVYQRRGDPRLLDGLLDLSPYTDGDLSEGMGSMLHEVARDNPRVLLLRLQHQPQKVWQSASYHIGFDIGSEVSAQRALPKLYRLSRTKSDPLHVPAERLLRGIVEGQKAA